MMPKTFPIYTGYEMHANQRGYWQPCCIYSFVPFTSSITLVPGTDVVLSETVADGPERTYLITAPEGAMLIDDMTYINWMDANGGNNYSAYHALHDALRKWNGFANATP